MAAERNGSMTQQPPYVDASTYTWLVELGLAKAKSNGPLPDLVPFLSMPVTDSRTDQITDSLVDHITDSRTDQLTDSRTDQVTDSRTDQVTGSFTDQLADSLACHVTDFCAGQLTDSLTDQVIDSSADQLTESRADQVTDSRTDQTLLGYTRWRSLAVVIYNTLNSWGMGNAACSGKAQLLLDASREVTDGAEEWMGKGLLAAERFVNEGELRLPPRVSEVALAQACKRVARAVAGEEHGGVTHQSRSSRAGPIELPGLFSVDFASQGDPECRRFEVLLGDGPDQPGSPAGAEEDGRGLAALVGSFGGSRAKFAVTLRVEFASVSYKKAHSPFRDGANVEEQVKQLLQQRPLDLAHFASNFGNCVVEKAFCGGVMVLSFAKGAADSEASAPHSDSAFEVEVARAVFRVRKSQRGGEAVFQGLEGKPALTLEQLEKQVRGWCKSFSPDRAGTRGIGQVVRLRLAPFSKIEGITVPPGLTQMDFERAAALEKAKEALARAERTRQLPELQEALDRAAASGLEDPRLGPLGERRRELDAALDGLRQAMRQQGTEALQLALARSEEAGLPGWEKVAHEEASACLAALLEVEQRARLRAAAEAADVRATDLVRILRDALPQGAGSSRPGFAHLQEFRQAEARLAELIAGLTSQAASGALTEEQARAYQDAFATLPDAPALSASSLAAAGFADATGKLSRRLEDRRELSRRRAELLGDLEGSVQQAESAPAGSGGGYEDLGKRLREADRLLPPEAEDAEEDEASPSTQSLRSLRSRGAALLREKEAMDQTARQVEARLQEATLGSSSVDALESALLDLSVKEQSGALHRATVAAQVVEPARRQLAARLRPELEAQLEAARSAPTSDGAGAEALARARHLLQRMEAACRPTCARECGELAALCAEAKGELEARKSRAGSLRDAREKLRLSVSSGDPESVQEALRGARSCGVPDEFTLDADARLRELQTAERQLRSALDSGDRVHLSASLEEACQQGLKTQLVDEARQRLQSTKTSALVDAIRRRDYPALGRAIADVEARGPEETAEVSDVLEQARAEYAVLDRVAKAVSSALGTLSYEELQKAVEEARRLNVATEDVRRAENVLGAMEDAVERLKGAVSQQPEDLGLLQESLGLARQQGLHAHPVYREAERLFSGTCTPAGLVWALEEQRRIWVVLCLRQPLPLAAGERAGGAAVAHPLALAVFELCHDAQISPEGEPYSVSFIHQALLELVRLPARGGAPERLDDVLRAALESFSATGPGGGGHGAACQGGAAGEVVDAHEFNRIGAAAKRAGLESTRQLLWLLVCLLEWESGQRLFLAFVAEQSQRAADLLSEVDSTEHSLRSRMTTLQAKGQLDDETGTGGPIPDPEISPEAAKARQPTPPPEAEKAGDPRVSLLRGVLEGLEQVKREIAKLQAAIVKSKGVPAAAGSEAAQDGAARPDVRRILELLRQACPRSLDEARCAVQTKEREASSKAREIYGDTYGALETKLLQLQYQGRLALDGEALSHAAAAAPALRRGPQEPPERQLPFATFSCFPEAAASLQDHAFLQLLGVPETPPKGSSGDRIDRCFQRVEIYDRFSENSGAVEDEFEKFCRGAVAEARQRCGGRRLVAALKPLLIDLVKRRQRISSMLNTLRGCGLDKVEKNLLRKHLQPRDILIALAFSSMPTGPSQARMMTLAAKTDSPLPLLFGWAQPPPAGATPAGGGSSPGGAGLQLCSQIHWGAFRELFCRPSCPLVLSLGTRETLGKSYLLQALYALQEVHLRGRPSPALRIHDMPSVDLIGDFAREESLRGVTLADVHGFDATEELCEALVSTLSSCASLMLLHVSLRGDFRDEAGVPRPCPGLRELLGVLAASRPASCATVLLLLRDCDADEGGTEEQKRLAACIGAVRSGLARGGEEGPGLLAWPVASLDGLGAQELGNEVKSLRKGRALADSSGRLGPSLEEALAVAAGSKHRFPSIAVLQERFEEFAAQLKRGAEDARHSGGSQPHAAAPPRPLLSPKSDDPYGALARRIFQELESAGSSEGLLSTLFPVAHCHQQLTVLSQEKVRCVNRGREFMEPEERRKLETSADDLDKRISKLRKSRQRAPPHALLRTFGQLVLAGDTSAIAAFGAYLDDWKQTRRAPLLEAKLRLRKELDQLIDGDGAGEGPAPAKAAQGPSTPARKRPASGLEPAGSPAPGPPAGASGGRVERLLSELGSLQRRLDEVDVSTDSFWLELMLWHELERIGERRGLREVDERLSYGAARACYLSWVKNGSPVHFLHSAPLQFGAFEPLRWHPQISGASLFGSDFVGDILRELDRDLGVDARRRPLLVISVIGVQSSGKSTLMNYLFGCSFATHVGRCTKGLYISLLETQRELIVILDTEGLLSVEARDDVFDKQVALMTMACSDLVIVNNRGELGRHVGDLFQVCLFALYHLKLARISPAIGFVLQCLSMVNQQQQYEWVATVKKSLEESVQELQQKEKPYSFKLQDLVFLDSESIFVMPSAFNDDVQFGQQVSRPTSLYALKALQLREKVFHWISRAKASQKQRLREVAAAPPPQLAGPSQAAAPSQLPALPPGQDAPPTSSFATLSQWYEHARTVWQTLSMCGTDLLQFRTMRQVLMAQQLQEFCDSLVQKHIEGRLSSEIQALIELHTRELRSAGTAGDVHATDNAFRGQLDSVRSAAMQEMHHEFDEFVKAHDTKFTDEQVKSDKRFSLMGPLRRKVASAESLWRSGVHLALEQRSMDHLFDEISARVNDLLLEQGASVNVENVERVFEEKWSQVMNETLRKQKPSLDKVVQEVVWHFNAALSNLKSQFRKAHIFHGVKSLSVQEMGGDSEVCNSFLLSKKGVGDALVPKQMPVASNASTQVDSLWIKLVDSMRLEVDQQGQMSDAAALKILNRLNSEMEAMDQLRQLLHRLGSTFVNRVFREIARATMQYRYQIEQQNFQSRVREIMDKKQQKLWEIQARVDSGKREVHCAKVWAKTFVDTLDQHFRGAVGRMAQEIVSHMSNILTNPGNACELAIERSFTKRNWRHVVMYAIDPTQYLFMEFHKEWEQFKQGLVDQYCQELKSNFGSCLRLAEDRMQGLLRRSSGQGAGAGERNMTMNRLSGDLRAACQDLADETISSVLCSCLPSFPSEADWPLNDLEQFVQFASVELRRYRANMRETEQTVEKRMEQELTRQKANCWKCICGCPARCPGCGTKCNLESENHWPERPHECRRHLYPAFNGWQKQEGRKPFLLHCRARAQWQIARTRPPIEPGGPERYWDDFQSMLEDEHPDWLDPRTRRPLPSMEPSEDYEEDSADPPEHIQKEIEENRRAWANTKDALLEHFTSMADDRDIGWLEKYKREGGALSSADFANIRDELFAVTPLESMEAMAPLDDSFEDSF
ncbi:unnamed protein product [Prorocentrum cordatum]|uniref:PARP n=1 Tax=Prorocentrum cordatum TaxID=2364126 RepID=A0ABN9T6Z1_9DINO|nr:unnamed protein product [Polarella glacialis]